MILLALLVADAAVLCIEPLPAADQFATAGKGASAQNYDDSPEARRRRVESAKKRTPVVFSIGDVTSVPVTDTQAACIDGFVLKDKVQLKANGKAFVTFTAEQPVTWLRFDAFYATDRIEAVPSRLYCKKRAPLPDCSWCPCKSRRYTPPPKVR